MASFSYIARSASGERLTGTVEAADRRNALLLVERMGCVPVSVKEGAAPPPSAKDKTKEAAKDKPRDKAKPAAAPRPAMKTALFSLPAKKGARQPRMGIRDLLLFSQELSDLLKSGMTLGTALNTLSKRETGKAQDQIVTSLRDEIVKGSSLSDALGLWPRTFSTLYISMVRAGEASGQVSEALERLCKHYERVQEAREKVLGALMYPAIVLSAGILTMIFVMVVVIPKFAEVFDDIGGTLPLPTQILMSTSTILLKYGWAVLILLFLAFGWFKRSLNTPAGRMRWDKMKMRMPVLKQIIAANAFGQFARTLGALLQNGVPVLQALSIVENTVGNSLIAQEIREARNRVTDGSSISGPLASGKVFPPLLTDMLAIGEQTGDMPGALANIARRFDSDLDRAVKVLTTVLEPILILVVAALVGFVAVSMLLAVFELTSGLKM